MNELIIKVRDYTILPGARHRQDGDNSADEFYEDHIKKYVQKSLISGQRITIDLDGTLGYASSFTSQLAIRIKQECKNKRRLIKKIIQIKSNDDPLQAERFWNEIKH